MERGADTAAAALVRKIADGVDGVEPGLVADLVAQPPVVDPAPEPKQPHAVAVDRTRPQPSAEPLQGRPEQGMRDGQRQAAGNPQDVTQRDRAGRGDVDRPADRVGARRPERAGGVVGVQELQPGIEPELRRDHREG